MIYKAGDAVPAEWFSKLEGVTAATFHADCEVSMQAERRVVSQISDGPYMVLLTPISPLADIQFKFSLETVFVPISAGLRIS